ncbi:MAG: DNA-binding protein [Actinomycetota bacterium]|nr:DNA-binding protein [Actinomycetota bacterium]
MRHRLIDETNGRRTFVVALEIGEEVVSTITGLARELSLGSSSMTGIGAFQEVRLGWLDWERSDFRENVIDEQVELLSLVGNIADSEEGEPKLHAHVVVARYDATTRGGHLVEAIVRPTLELVIVESPEHLQRRHDEKTGLVLLKP